MGTRYSGVKADWSVMKVHPAGTPIDLKDCDDEFLAQHAIDVSDGEDGMLVEGTKAQLVAMLQRALNEAYGLSDDPAEVDGGGAVWTG